MPPLPAFAGPDVERPAVGIEVRNPKAGKFAIASAGCERGAHEQAESTAEALIRRCASAIVR